MRIIVVDDHALFREGLVNLLKVNHFDVVGEAQDGFEALTLARTLHPDVVLMDIQMPRCDGLTATRLLQAELPDITVVMLTMMEDDANLFQAIRSGAHGYILKRAGGEEFLALFADLAQGHAPFSPGLAAKILDEFARVERAPAEHDPNSLTDLTPRQIEVLTLAAQGKTYHEISTMLGMSERTAKYHMSEIINRLHLKNRTEVIAFAARQGLDTQPNSHN
jgi:DNA-binding NarL/FixJ family response regulator